MIKSIRKSLMWKWLLFSILLGTIPLAIAGYNIIQIYRENLKRSVVEIEKDKAQMVAERTENFFEKVTGLLSSVCDESFYEGNLLYMKGRIKNLFYKNNFFEEMTLLDEKGQELFKVSKYETFDLSQLKNQSKSKIFETASKGQTYYGEFSLTQYSVPSMTIAVPIKEYKKESFAVLSAKIHLFYLWILLPQALIGKGGSTFVVDQQGNLLAHSDMTLVLSRSNLRHLPKVNQVINAKEGELEFEYPPGKKYLAVYKPINKVGGGVVVQVPVEEAYAPLRQITQTALKWMMIALGIAVILSLFLTRGLILPIKRLAKEMGEVSKGSLNIYVQPTTRDELGLLTESFNRMVQDLKQSNEALRKTEEKYRTISKAKSEWETTFDAVTTEGIILVDKNYQILRVNKRVLGRVGAELKDLIGKKCFEVLEHRDKHCERCCVSNTFITKKPTFLETQSEYTKNILQTSVFPIFDESGEVIGAVELVNDITEGKRLESEKEIVSNVNKILASSLDINEVVKSVRTEVNKILNADRMSITLFDEEEEGFRFFSSEKDYSKEALTGGVVYPLKGTNVKRIAETRMPFISNTTTSDSWITQKILEEEGIRSFLFFPLEYKGKVIGTMNFGSKKEDHFSEAHLSLLQQIAPGLAISIQNALLFEETKKRLDELTILYEITKVSTSSLSLDQMLTEMVNDLNRFFNFEKLGVLFVEKNTKRLVPHLSYKGHRVEEVEKIGLSLGKGITGWVAEKGEPLLVNDVRKDSRYIPLDEEILSEMCAPLKVGQNILGVIDAQSKKLNAFSADNLRLLNIAAGQIATLIENIHLQEEMKESEKRYRTVVEGALDGVCVFGGDYRLLYVNERFAEISGYGREGLIGTDARDYLDEKSKALIADREDQQKRGMKVIPYLELTVLRKDGSVRNVEASSRNIHDPTGDSNTIVIVKDITEKKKMEEQLFQSEKLRAVGEMASGVAHDFNNALAAILGNTQLLLYTVKEKSLKESLKVIEKVAQDSAETVKRLQDFTRRRIQQELSKVDINQVVKDSIEITKPRWKDEAQGRGIHIEMVSNLKEVPLASGIASELREVITNMIFNAIEAMPKGGKIGIQTFQKENHVYLHITDTGTGMTEEVKKKAFEPFFTTKPFSNTGLGLSMSYGIIKRFGGEIGIESKIGYGSTFTIILPIRLEEKEKEVISSMIEIGKEARILVIDDEETVRNVLSKILTKVKHRVTVAENGEEGLRLFKEKEFDLVLTDLGMPGISGWEVSRGIKKMSPYTPVGMITGWGMEVDQSKLDENGVDFVIPKPFQFNHILKVIGEVIASKGIH